MNSLASRAAVYSLVILLGLLSALPNILPASVSKTLPGWYAENTLALGLDLRGGSHLLLAVDLPGLLVEKNRQLADQLGDSLREAGIRYGAAAVTTESIRLPLTDRRQLDDALRTLRPLLKSPSDSVPLYSLSVDEGALLLEITPSHSSELQRDALERSLEVLRRRLNETGLVDPTITRQGDDSILVQLPGVDDPGQIRQLLGTTGRMTFHWVADADSQQHTAVIAVAGQMPGENYRLEQRVALAGKHISDARLAFNPDTREPVVNFRLDPDGARRFGEMTRDNIGRQLAIVLDDVVVTAPVIRGVIAGGSGEISGLFTPTEAADLALLLRAGALPAPLEVIEERTVGPDLGSDAIAMGITTGIIGTVLVFAFMLVVYGPWGLIACLGLAINIGLVFGVLSLLRATLSLPGIAGLILSIGMAVDANILINERIREETRRGRKAFSALDAGFKRAYATILDSNITSLIAISLLFLFGSGPVRGFAITMAIGLLVSLFTAISVTRLLMEWRVRRLGRRPLQISGIGLLDRVSQSTLNILRGRFIGLSASAVLSIASLALFVYPGLDYGIDFSGGSVVEVRTSNTSVEALRQELKQRDLGQAAIQEFGTDGSYLLRLPMAEAGSAQIDALKTAVLAAAPDASFPRAEMVGPRVSADFSDATILAILIAGAGMLAYLWLRFESHFALAATLTLALDLTKTIGFFALTGVEFNLTAVAALLALIGYSVNDKVVVFDRIHENLRLTPDKPLEQLLNESITATLTRTVFTSLTTFLALLPMAVAGGAAVASFALPMLFGIVIGTSSSAFIAAPLVLMLGRRRLRKGLAQLRPDAEELRREAELLP